MTVDRPKKSPAKKAAPRVRRTNAQIAADKAAAEARKIALAEERAAKIAPPRYKPAERVVHFLVDGYSACGDVRYYGEELTIKEGTHEWDLAFDRYGNYIFDLSPEEQIAQWGEQRYAEGPWTGKPYDLSPTQETDLFVGEGTTVELTPQEIALLKKVNASRLPS